MRCEEGGGLDCERVTRRSLLALPFSLLKMALNIGVAQWIQKRGGVVVSMRKDGRKRNQLDNDEWEARIAKLQYANES